MRVVVAGGHGQIALRLERLLAARGDHVVGLVRNPDHVPDLEAVGAAGLVLDLESAEPAEVAAVAQGADAVVFAAGAGPGSGVARKDTVDRAAATLLADAAERAGVRRYLLVSSVGVESPPPPGTDDVFAAYLRAKAAAEADLTARDLDWTVLRPGRLTDDPGTGFVQLERRVSRGSVPRDDVAAVLVALLDEPASAGLVLELVLGGVPVAEAVRRACADASG
jgi:uncharacterized protein YbjT (DUF2867 family)